jgi:hypothetical protein
MGRRLSRIDLFQPKNVDSWVVLLDPWWNVQAPPQKLPPGSDLLEAYLLAMLRFHREGWTVHEFSSLNASFFVTKGERRGWQVVLTQEEPGKAVGSRGIGR